MPIDRNKLLARVKELGITRLEFATSVGYKSWIGLSQAIDNNRVPLQCLESIKEILGIPVTELMGHEMKFSSARAKELHEEIIRLEAQKKNMEILDGTLDELIKLYKKA